MIKRYGIDPYLRVCTIYYLLQEMESGLSVNELAALLQVPPQIVLEDLEYLKKSDKFDIVLGSAMDDFDNEIDDWDYEADDFDDKTDIAEEAAGETAHGSAQAVDDQCAMFLKDLFAGKHMDLPLRLDSDLRNVQRGAVTMQLHTIESEILDAFLKDYHYTIGQNEKSFLIKRKYDDTLRKVMDTWNQLQEIIAVEGLVQIQYLTKKKVLQKITAAPIKLVKDIPQELFYLIAAPLSDQGNGNLAIYRLDRILGVQPQKGKRAVPPEIVAQLHQEYDYRWGMGAKEEPFLFRMQVFDEVNLPERLQHELKDRRYGTWQKYADGSYLYEDTVIGYDALKNWVLSLGSSVKVLEPKRLATNIKRSAKKRMQWYEPYMQDEILP